MTASIRRFRADVTIWIQNGPREWGFIAKKAIIQNLDGKIKVELSGPAGFNHGGQPAMRSKVFNITGYPTHPPMPEWLRDLVNEAMSLKQI